MDFTYQYTRVGGPSINAIEERYIIKHEKYSYKQYQQMAKYICHHDSGMIEKIEGYLKEIKESKPTIIKFYDDQGIFTHSHKEIHSTGAKSAISRLFRKIVEQNNDFDVYEKITGEDCYNPKEIWLSRKLGKACEKEKDFFSMDVCYLFKKYEKEPDKTIQEHLKIIRHDAIYSCYDKLQKTKKYKGIRKDFLEIKRIIWRQNYAELIITVGLRQEILELKERMTKEANHEDNGKS